MAFFKRVFSADYRRALAAEAAGDYQAAARAYALAGERAKVAEMHLCAAERAGAGNARIAELRAGVRWADEHTDEGRAIRRRLARALVAHVRATGVISESDRAILRQAATLFSSAGDFAGAGECHELAGEDQPAAEAYQQAGEVERLEAVLAREEARRQKEGRHRDAFAEYQLAMASGHRRKARAQLAQALAAAPDPQLRDLAADLDGKLLAGGQATLRAGDRLVTYTSAFPIALGREPGCHLALRDAGISRRHAEVLEAGGRFRVRDCASRNGTLLGGVRLADRGELPLEGEGQIGLGEHCDVSFRAGGAVLALEVVRGLDRGLRLVAGAGAIEIERADAFALRFDGGRPILAARSGATLLLNGVMASAEIELARGDTVEVDGQRVDVV